MRLFIIHQPVRLKKQSIVAVLCLVLSLIGFFNLNAQGVYGWDKTYGGSSGPDEAMSIIQTRDNGFVMVGSSNSFGNSNQIYIVRTDVDGKELWTTPVLYGGSSNEVGTSVTSASNGGFIVVGNGTNLGSGGGNDIVMLHLNDAGNIINEKFFSTNRDEEAYAISSTNDGGYIMTGYQEDSLGIKDLLLVKLDSDLNVDWSNTYDSDSELDDVGNAVVQTSNGFFVATGRTSVGPNAVNIFLIRVNSLGVLDFKKNYSSGENFNEGNDLVIDPTGTIFITGQVGNNSNVGLVKVLSDGTFEFFKTYDSGNGLVDIGNAITISSDNNLVIAGSTEPSGSNIDVMLLKVDMNGDTIWQRMHGQEGGQFGYFEFGESLVETNDGGFAIAGSRAEGLSLNNFQYYLIRTDNNGLTLTNHIIGNAFRDLNNDCTFQAGEEGVCNWIVEAKGERTFYGSVDANGNYDILTDTGEYTLNIIAPNVYWNTCQPVDLIVNQPNSYDTVYVDYPVQAIIDCPQLEIDISTPRIIPCESNVYRIDYCNHGTLPVIGGMVEVILDEKLNFNNSTIAVASQIDSLYTFDIGVVNVGDCGFFEIDVTADCGTTIENETHCVEAHIIPNESCLAPNPNWDGSDIKVDGYCDGDEVVFNIRNNGTGDMIDQSVYIVVEDWVIMFEGQPQPIEPLIVGQTKEIRLPANGKTYRLIAEQSADHPGRNFFSTTAIEACDPNNVGATLGAVNQFEEDDRDPFVSISCQENKLAFEPLELIGYPNGYKDTCIMSTDFAITSQTDLEYHIRFQNIGSDTLGNVVVRDTIPSHLDVRSIRPGTSSHPYTFEAYGTGWVKFTFSDLELPSNTSNEMLSHGFVKYRISQKPDNPVGSLIEHDDALIYELYEAPKATNGVTHIVGGDEYLDFVCFLTDIENPNFPNAEIKIFPNPFTDFATIEISGVDFKTMNLHITDMTGREIRTESFDTSSFHFYKKGLAQGMYMFTLETDGQVVQSGKMIIQ